MKKEIKLLIADDSTLVRNNLKRLLEDAESIRIFESRDTKSTMEMIDKIIPDILLLDLRMPGGTGLDVLQYLGEKDEKPVAIVLSNIASEESRKKCLKIGADYVFDKSMEHQDAVKLIKQIVRVSVDNGGVEYD